MTNLPPLATPMVLQKAKSAYSNWNGYLEHLPRIQRYTLGEHVDQYFIGFLEILFRTSFTGERGEKLTLLTQSINKLDLIKFFLQICWERKYLDNKKYTSLSEQLDEVGRMLGGWRKQLSQKTPPR